MGKQSKKISLKVVKLDIKFLKRLDKKINNRYKNFFL